MLPFLPDVPSCAPDKTDHERCGSGRVHNFMLVKRGRRGCGIFRTSPYPLAAGRWALPLLVESLAPSRPAQRGAAKTSSRTEILPVQLPSGRFRPLARAGTKRLFGRRGRFRRNLQRIDNNASISEGRAFLKMGHAVNRSLRLIFAVGYK